MEKTTKETAENILYGNKKQLILPSGYWVTIREQNGNDDDILSNQATAKDLTNVNIFLSSLIIETNLPMAVNGKLSSDNVRKILLRDKYFILFASRAHSMGDIVKFQFDWGEGNGGILEYSESLSVYLWDYSKPFPLEGEENYSRNAIIPYPVNAYEEQEVVLKTGKHLKYHFLDGNSEKALMDLPLTQYTRNSEIKARGLKQLVNEQWVKVDNFMYFSKSEMGELNAHIKNVDPLFAGTTEVVNPETNEVVNYPIMRAEGFFYPEEF